MNYQSEIDIQELVNHYNINEIFTEKANFRRLSDNPIYVGEMSQKITLKIACLGVDL